MIAELNTALILLQEQVELNTGDIVLLEEQNALQDQLLVVIGDKVDDLNQQVDANAGDIASLFLLDAAQQMLILALSETISNLQDQINAGADVTALADEIAILTARVDQVEIDIQGKQARLLQACPSGSAIRVINADGSVVCATASAGGGTLSTLSRWSSWSRGFSQRQVFCPSTHRVTGGSYRLDLCFSCNQSVIRDEPVGNGWFVMATGTQRNFKAVAQCARVN